MMKFFLLLVINLFIFSTGCSKSSNRIQENVNILAENKPDLSSNANQTELTPMPPVRFECKVDFRNFIYPLPLGYQLPDEKIIELKNGRSEPTRDDRGHIDKSGYSLTLEYYADIDNDGNKEAFILINVSTGGTYNPDILYVYDVSKKVPALIWVKELGNRADDGLRKLYFDGKMLILETYINDTGGSCCPKSYTRTKYIWKKRKIRRVEKIMGIKREENESESADFFRTDSDCNKK